MKRILLPVHGVGDNVEFAADYVYLELDTFMVQRLASLVEFVAAVQNQRITGLEPYGFEFWFSCVAWLKWDEELEELVLADGTSLGDASGRDVYELAAHQPFEAAAHETVKVDLETATVTTDSVYFTAECGVYGQSRSITWHQLAIWVGDEYAALAQLPTDHGPPSTRSRYSDPMTMLRGPFNADTDPRQPAGDRSEREADDRRGQ